MSTTHTSCVNIASDGIVTKVKGLEGNGDGEYIHVFNRNNSELKHDTYICKDHLDSSCTYMNVCKKRNVVICQRDVLGEGCIYFRNDKRGIVISNKIEALFNRDEMIEVDAESICMYLTFQYIPFNNTPLKNVCKLKPGEQIEIYKGHINTIKINNIISYGNNLNIENDVAIDDLMIGVFNCSGLVGLGRCTALYLSGGVDSSSNLLTASLCKLHVKSITAGFDDSEYDETEYAISANNHFKYEHEVVNIPSHDPTTLQDYIHKLREPICDRALIPTNYLFINAAGEASRLISGEGGDELWGPPRRWSDELRDATSDVLLMSGYINNIDCSSDHIRKSLIGHMVDIYAVKNKAIAQCIDVAEASNARNNYEKIKATVLSTWLPENVIAKEVSVAGHHAKVYFPLVHHRCVNYVSSKDMDAVENCTMCKGALKEYMEKYYSSNVMNKPKHKFKVPSDIWITYEMIKTIKMELCGRHSYVSSVMDTSALKDIIDDVIEGHKENERLLWGIYVLEHWCRGVQRTISHGNLEKS